MKFVCLGFIDEKKYAELSEAEGQRMITECFDYDDSPELLEAMGK